jgi:hypothetical protein
MRITDGGKVGIGTTDPRGQLQVDRDTGTSTNAVDSTLLLRESSGAATAGVGSQISLSFDWNNSGNFLDGAPFIRSYKVNSNNSDYHAGLKFGTRTNGVGTATVAMTLDHLQNVGIGTTNPDEKLVVDVGAPGASDKVLGMFRSETSREIGFVWDDSQSTLGIATLTNHAIAFHTNGNSNERMRIDSAGRVLIGRTSTLGYKLDLLGDMRSERSAASGTHIVFTNSGGNKGTITTDASGTTYNTTSDIRLKTDIAPIADATDKLMAMNAVTHKWKADPDADAVVGFIAQEMADIVPQAVSKGEGEDDMWSMDYGRITPVIVAALQDALKEIDMLKDRIAELEAK